MDDNDYVVVNRGFREKVSRWNEKIEVKSENGNFIYTFESEKQHRTNNKKFLPLIFLNLAKSMIFLSVIYWIIQFFIRYPG
ncbi:hypothetical protein GCM10010840_36400 [Deinococcus aerolatus]|uniref:Uncharacterized protein n=2 Tax=Deinococcus aerolatus TaxID=522487 RepID=A0ABQ2GH20_9DEIO|nr:hypothetical protein GCM10010840_36400 [Deinococcus aerolatus]